MDKKVTADTRELPDISQEFKAKKDGDGGPREIRVQHAHGGLPSAEPDGQRFCFAVHRAVLRISAQEYPTCRIADSCRQQEHLYRHRKVVPAREQQPPAACGTQRRRQSGERGRDHAVQCTQPRKVPLSAESDHAQAQSCKKAQRCKCQHWPDRTQHGIAAAECC